MASGRDGSDSRNGSTPTDDTGSPSNGTKRSFDDAGKLLFMNEHQCCLHSELLRLDFLLCSPSLTFECKISFL